MKKQTAIAIKLSGFCLLLSIQLSAQLCTGGVGDIVWQQNFGAVPNPGAALPPGTTNYIYTPSSCPAEGFYTILNTIGGCSSWWNIGTCCTPADGAYGYMMLINVGNHPGDVY